ncbi:MAG: hypothetical protein ACD_46C00327G0007 [uncultured bacterium]|nr:MAG: hypothetical protein ACD_46C00327G0007 [uncultured bacterium]
MALSKHKAIIFVVLMGIISMFADVTYEGARSITGPYLRTLGANAAIVGFVAGLGEFLGYGLRLLSGYFVDRTERYWLMAIIGYVINLLSVPMLSLTGSWQFASGLIVAERVGKGIRNPARDAMLSYAGERMGMGWGFGLHEALDKFGAMLGPLLIALILFYHTSYQASFAYLFVPAFVALMVLAIARFYFPHPQHLAVTLPVASVSLKKHSTFWLYLMGAAFIAMGYADFPLIAYHFANVKLFLPVIIPITYAMAMGINVIAAPVIGRWYDVKGFPILIIVSIISCFSPLLLFMGNEISALIGIALWGIGIGTQETLMRSIIGNMVGHKTRGMAYGIFNAGFGLFWFFGSAIMGILYDYSPSYLVIFSIAAQILALPLLWKVKNNLMKNPK